MSPMTARSTAALALGVLLVCAAPSALLGCNDATHDEEVAALGAEDPAVPPGPDHRPGQPCLTCHGGIGPAKQQFSIGGTVYAVVRAARERLRRPLDGRVPH